MAFAAFLEGTGEIRFLMVGSCVKEAGKSLHLILDPLTFLAAQSLGNK